MCLFFFLLLNESQYSSPYNCLWLLSVRCRQNRLQTKWISLQNIRIQQTISISIQIHGCVVWSASLSKNCNFILPAIASNHRNENHQTSLSLNTLTIPDKKRRKKNIIFPPILDTNFESNPASHAAFTLGFPHLISIWLAALFFFYSSYCSFLLPHSLSHNRKNSKYLQMYASDRLRWQNREKTKKSCALSKRDVSQPHNTRQMNAASERTILDRERVSEWRKKNETA